MAHKSSAFFLSLGRILNNTVIRDSKSLSAKFEIPGFQYGYFDRAGRVNIYNINMLLETGRLLGYSNRVTNFFPIDPSNQTLMIMLSQRFTVSKDLQNKACMDFPMMFESKVIAVGRSSVVREVSLTSKQTGERVATVMQKIVNVDKTTRKSTQLTEKMRETYDNVVHRKPDDVFQDLSKPELPSHAFSVERRVYHSDMDIFFHTNQGSYMRFGLDCAASAIKSGIFDQFHNDICFYNASSAATLHSQESFAGDVVRIHTWEDTTVPYRVHFMATKDPKTILYYSFIDFEK